jgi:hypothetical protein
MTIDDRAFHFQGVFPTAEWLLAFKPWNKKVDGPFDLTAKVVLNGMPVEALLRGQYITFDDIVRWCHDRGGRRGQYTITWRAQGRSAQGALSHNGVLAAEDGLVIDATITDNA